MANILNLLSEEAFIEKMDAQNALLAAIASNNGGCDVTAWADIRQIVRMGLGASLFPVGYEFTTADSVTGATITWVVRGHDHHAAADSKLRHTMTLEAKYVYSNASGTYQVIRFDENEAMYYAETALAAGTYNFTWNYAAGALVNGTYQFTLSQAVPAGGQIVLGRNGTQTAITNCKMSTYSTVGGTSPIESNVVISSGSGGTSLGTINESTSSGENLNCAQRIILGSNNYAQSAVRQWLNSSAAAGSVWAASNIFDRSPTWNASCGGFMRGLPADFLAAVQPAKIPCRTNGVFEVDSLDGTEYAINQVYELQDEFFLLSRPEIYGTWDSTSYKDGELLEYYEGLTDTERKKYDVAGNIRYCWCRSPIPYNTYSERGVNTVGATSYTDARYSHGVAPACIIA